MKKYLYIIALITIFTSCEKFLTEEPTTSILSDKAITSSSDLEAVLYGTYDVLQSENVYGGNFTMFGDLLADDSNVDEGRLTQFGTREIYNMSTTIQIGYLRNAWSSCYATINRANTIIYYIDNNLISDSKFDLIKDDYKGQALFIRAITHFQLLNFWSKPYDIGGNNTQLGIPYKKTPTLSGKDDMNIARNTVEEVYTNIINDLIEAQDLIEGITHKSLVSKMAATAFLARVYFFKGDYVNASIEANKVITSGKYSLINSTSINELYSTQGDNVSKEIIFQLVNIETDQSNSLPGYYQSSKGAIFTCTDEFFKSFTTIEDTLVYTYGPSLGDTILEKDTRIKNLIAYNSFQKKAYISKWNQITSIANNVPIIRLAEMHLIRAEANYLSGGSATEAQESYKAIRVRSVGNEIFDAEGGEPAWTDDDFLVKIRAERRRELAFEGDRYLNLRRLKLPVRNGVAYNDNNLLFKIPQEEMSGNSLMVQN